MNRRGEPEEIYRLVATQPGEKLQFRNSFFLRLSSENWVQKDRGRRQGRNENKGFARIMKNEILSAVKNSWKLSVGAKEDL